MLTEPTPGLPLIAALGADGARIRAAVAAAFAGLDPGTRAELGLAGFVPLAAADYDLIRARADAAERLVTI